jgi:hypothetical protein
MHTSIAQVFNERGRGVAIKGRDAKVSESDFQPHIAPDDVSDLVSQCIKAFRDEHKTSPARVVVHKTSNFEKGEMAAFRAAIEAEKIALYDLVTLDKSRIRLYRDWQYCNSISSLSAWSFPEAINGSEYRPICLSSVPELAACYCGRRAAGGEVAQMVRGCIRDLRGFLRNKDVISDSLRAQLEEYEEALKRGRKARVVEVSRSWLRSELLKLAPLENRLLDLCRRKHIGLIYALRFEAGDVAWLGGSHDTYISERPIPSDRIIAKARIIGSRCEHLDRWPERYFRDYQDPSTLMGAIAAWSQSSQLNRHIVDEWDRAPIDSALVTQ